MVSRSAIHNLERTDRRGRGFIAVLMLVSISVLASSWLGLFTFMTASAAHGSFVEIEEKYIPNVESEALNFPDLSRVSRVYASNGTLLAELHDGRVSEPTPFEEVPDVVVYAVLSAEDADFFQHDGIDWQAIISAARDNLVSETTRGGSTITQQVVKKTFVGEEQTLKRKIREAVTAIELERRYSKEQILEFYMNSVYFGASAYGVNAASEEFFQKNLDELSIAEAATLAVLPRNPTEYNPRRNFDAVLERRDEVIREMYENGFITEAARDQAWAQPLQVEDPTVFVSPDDHVVAEVKRQLLSEPEFAFLGATREERKIAVFGCPADDADCDGGGGLNITLSIDLDLQDSANDLLQTWLPVPSDPDQSAPTGAIAMVDNWTGAVRVMSSGLPFEQEQFDLAVQGRRNPGSSFKPFALVAALESGISLNSFWDASSPKDVQCPYTCSSLGNIWRVRNAGGGRAGLMRLFDATYNSVNTVYAQVSVAVGPEQIIDVAHRMGIKSELAPVPSIALGAGAVSPLEMASAYSNFATNGLWSKPYIVESITNSAGEMIYQHEANPIQTIDPSLAAAARQPLEVVPVSGTAPRANLGGRPQGGKTGTHQNFMEAWFVGFVAQYSAAVWIGFPEEQVPLTNVVINGQTLSRVFGGTGPAPLWKEFMQIALADVPVESFPPDPSGTTGYFKTPVATVPSVVGLSRGSAVNALLNAHLNASVVETPSNEPEGTVIAQAPGAGAVVNEGSAVTIEVSTGILPTAPVPDLFGLKQAQVGGAIANWEAANGIDVEWSFRFVEARKKDNQGVVIAVTPPPGTVVENGAFLIVTVGIAPKGDGG